MTTLAMVLGGIWIFMLGATIGSFANVCIYRIALEKSIIWPGSHCPRCLTAIAFRDNVPILGWISLRGKCRTCGLPISVRYPLIEGMAGLLFVAVAFSELGGDRFSLEVRDFLRLSYHLLLVSFLLVATFIDFDYYILPDSIIMPGIALGLAIGTVFPEVRPAPNQVTTAWDGFIIGLTGLLMGGGTIWAVRILGRLIAGREAMGFGDVTLMAMIGAFLGWQVVPPTLFLGAILGLVQGLYKLAVWVEKLILRQKSRSSDREIPFGPYLSMAAVLLMLAWPWLWKGPLSWFYITCGQAARFLATGAVD